MSSAYLNLLHPLIEVAAARYPDHIAIYEGTRKITYKELVLKAASLASTLQNHGIRGSQRVAIHLDKSSEAVIAILGILMSGACYVPIDSRNPPLRTAAILADCQIRTVIGTTARLSRVLRHLPSSAEIETLICLDDGIPQFTDIRQVPWETAISSSPLTSSSWPDPEEPAYIFYTSGTTGSPKGVVISHRASHAFVQWAASALPLSACERVISQAPFHFDLSVYDIFLTLSSGASLVVPQAGLSISPSGFSQFLEEARINVLYATPPLLTTLSQDASLHGRDLSRLREILFAGDVMPPRTLIALMRAIPAAKFTNLYGPTETNVCTYFPVTTSPTDDSPIPIGKQCKGTNVQLVNDGICIPDGAGTGELWVSGSTLMTGYWNRPHETAERLVTLNGVSDTLWYRTGDRVRRDENGLLHFCSRIDRMLKIYGYRVEPEEVEHILRNHTAVRDAVIFKMINSRGEASLGAVVWKQDEGLTVRDLQRYCAMHLLEPMIPTTFQLTDGLPLLSTGKIDRKRIEREFILINRDT